MELKRSRKLSTEIKTIPPTKKKIVQSNHIVKYLPEEHQMLKILQEYIKNPWIQTNYASKNFVRCICD